MDLMDVEIVEDVPRIHAIISPLLKINNARFKEKARRDDPLDETVRDKHADEKVDGPDPNAPEVELKVDQYVTAINDMTTDSTNAMNVKKGVGGRINRIDESGDAAIDFELDGYMEWVFKENFYKLRVVPKEEEAAQWKEEEQDKSNLGVKAASDVDAPELVVVSPRQGRKSVTPKE